MEEEINYKEIYKQYFINIIRPKLFDLEKQRKRKVVKILFKSGLFFICGLFFAAIFILLMFNMKYNPILWSFVLFLMYAFIIKSIVVIISSSCEYSKEIEHDILPLFYPIIANYVNWPENHSVETLIDSKLFPNFDTQEDVKSIFGFYNDTNIIISNTKLTLPVDGVDKHNLFKGVTIQLELNLEKSFNNHLILISKNERKFNHYNAVNINAGDLNKFIYTYVRNPENIDLINENIWNKLKFLSEAYNASSFLMSVNNNIILIAMRCKNPFQIGSLFNSLLKFDRYKSVVNRFARIYELIDLLQEKNNSF